MEDLGAAGTSGYVAVLRHRPLSRDRANSRHHSHHTKLVWVGVVMCEVVNLLQTSDWDVYIGRPRAGREYARWGNPFVVGSMHEGRVVDRERAISLYRDWLLNSPAGLRLQEDIDELRGKVLACYCKPQPCHGDVLVELLGQREMIPDVKT